MTDQGGAEPSLELAPVVLADIIIFVFMDRVSGAKLRGRKEEEEGLTPESQIPS